MGGKNYFFGLSEEDLELDGASFDKRILNRYNLQDEQFQALARIVTGTGIFLRSGKRKEVLEQLLNKEFVRKDKTGRWFEYYSPTASGAKSHSEMMRIWKEYSAIRDLRVVEAMP